MMFFPSEWVWAGFVAAIGLLAVGVLFYRRRKTLPSATNLPVPSSKSQLPYRHADQITNLVGAFESETAAVIDRTTPNSEHTILYVLVVMLVVSFGLTAVVKLDRVVTGTGVVAPISGNLFVSPLDKAIVKEVLVKTGDVVKKGQTLAILDPTFAAADLSQLQQKLASDTAEVQRREAEVSDKPYVPATRDTYGLLQLGIWQQRQAAYKSGISNLDAQINATRAALGQAQRDSGDYQKRLALAEKAERMNLDLQKHGYVTEQAAMAATDSRVEMERLLGASRSQIDANQHALESLIAQRQAFNQQWHSDAGSDLVTVRNDLDTTTQALLKAQKIQDLVRLDAPSDAVVLKIGKISQGAVVNATAGQGQGQEPLFTLVPLTATLEAELKIPAEDIGFIQPGDPVQIKLDAYSFLRHGIALGEVKTISEGSFTVDEDTNAPVPAYFKARITIKEVKLHNVPANFRLIPGMTLQADVMVGKRTILSYLVEGVLRTGAEAMREPN
jgi:HlyD family type I secretion membrane fusion protein